MVLWVYISKDGNTDLRVGMKVALSGAEGRLISSLKPTGEIVYLRPFNLPFDALAHKHILSDLSKKSVLLWIKKNKEETKKWLNVI